MGDDHVLALESASKLQEAIDTVVQTFDHPDAVSIDYAFEDGTKRTTFEIGQSGEGITYELVYEGRADETEPKLRKTD